MKLKLKFLLVLFVGLLSTQLVLSDEASSVETVQLSLTVTSTGQLNISAVKQVEKGINAFDAIDLLVVMGSKETDWGPQIMSLGGIEAIGNTYWALYVNGKMSMVGAKDVILDDNTFIHLNLEAF
ncbi:MAG: DUF4430 domain-containing protein [Candidatus Thioglobus sp.]|jgi:hypothetical protein|nr:DUF4430 domain-containing protein [Candidatus Thioglobus sp.]|tara:strand:- start:204 stop:578 length:375 start_codon:yes stop_codon:yes gene_type:complete